MAGAYTGLASAWDAALPADPWMRFAACSAASGAGAVLFALVSMVTESAAFAGYRYLERQGLIERLVAKDVSIDGYQLATFKTFVASLWPPLLWVSYNLGPLLSSAAPCWDPLRLLPQLVKFLYRRIHAQHHNHLFADLHVFQTADMHFVEAFALTMGFYGGLLWLSLTLWGSWDPVLFYAYVILEANMNMGGHCGYHMPPWLQFLVTWGIGNTPWSASSKTHFIHHLDPRTNHALYFTWVDRMAGTFRGSHPKIREFTPEEWAEYSARPWRLLAKRLRPALGW
ncbi:MAG: hypothetical protein J3K34DRAFT_516802 [Monoraphidium minutum]|nr:MAG: hypothetical protein J3K34DRAFT_516802 [Monoraphidium minutum]